MAIGVQQPAFVLRKRPFQETSEIVDLFTPEQGRVSCVVKGAKRKRVGGSLAQRLQLFRPLVVRFQGRGDLKTLVEADDLREPYSLRDDCFYAACYANELLLRVLQQEEVYAELFAGYASLLDVLASGLSPREPLRRFEWRVLQSLGADLDLTVGANGVLIEPDKWYDFEADVGWVEVLEHTSMRPVSGRWLLALAHNEPRAWVSKFARELCQMLLLPYVGETPFKSRILWQQQSQQQ